MNRWLFIIFLLSVACLLATVLIALKEPEIRVIYMPTTRYEYIEVLAEDRWEEVELPGVSGEFKSFMDYRKITDRSSKQWALQQLATTDAEGYRRFNNAYLCAMGEYYAEYIGRELLIELESGEEVLVMVGDIKASRDTDKERRYTVRDKSVLEFIVDARWLSARARIAGSVGVEKFKGEVRKIKVVK